MQKSKKRHSYCYGLDLVQGSTSCRIGVHWSCYPQQLQKRRYHDDAAQSETPALWRNYVPAAACTAAAVDVLVAAPAVVAAVVPVAVRPVPLEQRPPRPRIEEVLSLNNMDKQ